MAARLNLRRRGETIGPDERVERNSIAIGEDRAVSPCATTTGEPPCADQPATPCTGRDGSAATAAMLGLGGIAVGALSGCDCTGETGIDAATPGAGRLIGDIRRSLERIGQRVAQALGIGATGEHARGSAGQGQTKRETRARNTNKITHDATHRHSVFRPINVPTKLRAV